MLKILPAYEVYSSTVGHYGFYYPDLETRRFAKDEISINATALQYLCPTRPSLRAYKIDEALAQAWDTNTVIWIEFK